VFSPASKNRLTPSDLGRVSAQTIPATITPKNRVLIGVPVLAGGHAEQSPGTSGTFA